MNKIELKHLAFYLPYELRGMRYSEAANGYFYKTLDSGNILSWMDHLPYKPILRPLSDLTKEVEGIGVPMLKILEINGKSNRRIENCKFDGSFIYETGFHYGREVNGQKNTDWKISETIFLKELSFTNLSWLLKNHFDVFGLIDKNLAWNFNTIKK